MFLGNCLENGLTVNRDIKDSGFVLYPIFN